jgi:hypothetical protein
MENTARNLFYVSETSCGGNDHPVNFGNRRRTDNDLHRILILGLDLDMVLVVVLKNIPC